MLNAGCLRAAGDSEAARALYERAADYPGGALDQEASA
jgi:hypothetical protein